jgi:hypothetical protein
MEGVYDPPIFVPKGELVADAVYFNQVQRVPRWYTPAEILTTVCLQQVILADLLLCNESEGSWLPNTCNKIEARCKGARKVSEYDHSRMLDKISRMDILEFSEDEDDIMDCSGSDGGQSSDKDDDHLSDSEASDS